MKHEEALEVVGEMQRIAERTTLYTILPKQAAVIGGGLALAGCVVSYAMIQSLDFSQVMRCSQMEQLIFVAMWMVIGITAIVQDVILTTLDAKKQGIFQLKRPGKLSAYSLTPSVFVAVVITAKLLMSTDMEITMQNIRYIAPVWMMCYGTGVYAAGLFSVRLPRLLGLAFIIMGTAGLLFFESYGIVLVGLSFGLMHIIFGLIVIGRTGRSQQK